MSETVEVSDSSILGQLEVVEQETLSALRQNAQALVGEIGQIEVRKARLLGALSEVENRAQDELGKIGKRLGVPEGKPWQVTPDGKALLVDDAESASAEA
jgi:hypothetical protein